MNLKILAKYISGNNKVGPNNKEVRALVFQLANDRKKILNLKEPQIRHFLDFALSILPKTQSQFFQDAFVLYILKSKKQGFYCEFGATNGYDLSNSFTLDTHYSWDGICAEPAKNWQHALLKNRKNARIETDCVWSKTGSALVFSECDSKELSTLSSFTTSSNYSKRLKKSKEYEVKTISLNDLLEKHKAPINFDYLSMDTEGSEVEILQAFDINKWQPKVVTIEHNYTNDRSLILQFMEDAGYKRVLTEVSCCDDWYLAPGVKLPKIDS